jgi:hypothetical protein
MLRRPAALLLAAACLAIAGCDSAPATVREGLGFDVPVHTRVFQADRHATYAAAKAALEPMGYRYVKGGAAQGYLEAISDIAAGESMTSSHQFELKANFENALDGGTEVSVRITEIIEEDSEHQRGRATESPVTDTPLYEVFFRGVQQGIRAPSHP